MSIASSKIKKRRTNNQQISELVPEDNKNNNRLVYFIDAALSESSSVGDSSYTCDITEITATNSVTTKKSARQMWTLSLCELESIVTEKVEMKTSNDKIRSIHDSCHAVAINGKLKPNDKRRILNLSGLFDCETELSISSISVKYVACNTILSEGVKRTIACLNTSIENRIFMKLDHNPESLEDLQLNHIIPDLYLNFMNNLNKGNELNLIAKYLGCILNSLWSSHDHVQIKWDKSSQATSKTDPTNCKIQPDNFYTNINDKSFKVGNGEIKRKTASKKEVDETRTRMLDVCIRQLHLRMKHAGTADDLVTFGVLVYVTCELRLRYEFYLVSYVNGYYPFEKFAWGEFASSDDGFKNLESTFKSLIQLKKSMELSLSLEGSNSASSLDTNKLLPTVTYFTEYR
ncbi:hypothetical protein G6F36_012701 [Rhizopus arrhizus]|nr:hypothetical protein G6F36_012701 [Rhizopus arrhizus]